MPIDADQLIYDIPAHRWSRLGCTPFRLNTPPNEWYQVAGCTVNASFVPGDPALVLTIQVQGAFQEGEILLVRFVLQNNYGEDLDVVEFTELLPVEVTAPAAATVIDGESIAFEYKHLVTSSDITAGFLTFAAKGVAGYDDGMTVIPVETRLVRATAKAPI
jgi:hypothetical protein